MWAHVHTCWEVMTSCFGIDTSAHDCHCSPFAAARGYTILWHWQSFWLKCWARVPFQAYCEVSWKQFNYCTPKKKKDIEQQLLLFSQKVSFDSGWNFAQKSFYLLLWPHALRPYAECPLLFSLLTFLLFGFRWQRPPFQILRMTGSDGIPVRSRMTHKPQNREGYISKYCWACCHFKSLAPLLQQWIRALCVQMLSNEFNPLKLQFGSREHEGFPIPWALREWQKNACPPDATRSCMKRIPCYWFKSRALWESPISLPLLS